MSIVGSRERKGTAALACAVVAAISFAGPASAGGEKAGQKKVKTKTSLTVTCLICRGAPSEQRLGIPIEFSGKIKSRAGKCLRSRQVTVIQTSGKIMVAEATSEQDGSWSTGTVIGGSGDYRAIVDKKQRGETLCKKGKSKKASVANRASSSDQLTSRSARP